MKTTTTRHFRSILPNRPEFNCGADANCDLDVDVQYTVHETEESIPDRNDRGSVPVVSREIEIDEVVWQDKLAQRGIRLFAKLTPDEIEALRTQAEQEFKS